MAGYGAKVLSASLALLVLAHGCCALAQGEGKGIRFWNLTLHTVTHLQMSPAGESSWGPDQCRNDRDGSVEHDERLRITGIAPGFYDARLEDDTGRKCIVQNIAVRAGAVFSIEERQLTECGE